MAAKKNTSLATAEKQLQRARAAFRKAEAKVKEIRQRAKLEREIKAKGERLKALKKRRTTRR